MHWGCANEVLVITAVVLLSHVECCLLSVSMTGLVN